MSSLTAAARGWWAIRSSLRPGGTPTHMRGSAPPAQGGRAAPSADTYSRGVPQVSADVHVPLPPSVARALAASVGEPALRLPPHVTPEPLTWRFDAERDGTLVVLTLAYAVDPGWVRSITHEVTQWSLAKQLRTHLATLTDAGGDPVRVERARSSAGEG